MCFYLHKILLIIVIFHWIFKILAYISETKKIFCLFVCTRNCSNLSFVISFHNLSCCNFEKAAYCWCTNYIIIFFYTLGRTVIRIEHRTWESNWAAQTVKTCRSILTKLFNNRLQDGVKFFVKRRQHQQYNKVVKWKVKLYSYCDSRRVHISRELDY